MQGPLMHEKWVCACKSVTRRAYAVYARRVIRRRAGARLNFDLGGRFEGAPSFAQEK